MRTDTIRKVARFSLALVALVGAALSWRSLYLAAIPVFGRGLAVGFPLLVDLLILGTSAQYIVGAKAGRPRAGWKLAAHGGVAGTILLNGLAAHSAGEIPWHLTAPIVWSVLCELTARDVLGEYRATHNSAENRIPMRLWLSAPVESVRAYLLTARTNATSHIDARLSVGIHAAAREALRMSVDDSRVRSVLARQLRAGSLAPQAVLSACGWSASGVATVAPQDVLRAALGAVLGAPVTAVTTPDFLGGEAPSVTGQPSEEVPETAADDADANRSKKDMTITALINSRGNVKAALAQLSEWGVQVSPTYAYAINRELKRSNTQHTVVQLRK